MIDTAALVDFFAPPVNPPAPPTPAPPAVPRKAPSWLPWVLVAAAAAYVYHDHNKPAPAPTADAPLVSILRDNRDTQGATFKGIAARVRSKELATVKSVADAFAAHSKPLSDEVKRVVTSGADASGNVTNADAIAAPLDAAARSLGAK